MYPCAEHTLLRTLDCPFPGVDSQIAGRILEILHVTYQIVFFNDSNLDWGSVKNGSDSGNPYSGLLGLLYDGTFDMISAGYLIFEQRITHFQFSYPFRTDRFYFVVRKSEISLETTALLVFRTFSPALWATNLAALIFLAMSMFFSQKILIFSGENNSPFRRILLDFYHFILNQAHEIPSNRKRSMSASPIFAFLSIFSVVTMSMYQGSLLSRLLVNRERAPFDSLEELVDLIEEGKFNVIGVPRTCPGSKS